MKTFTHPLFGKCKVLRVIKSWGVLIRPATRAGKVLLQEHTDHTLGHPLLETRAQYIPIRLQSML